MRVVIESGSTKADWRLWDDGHEPVRLHTTGFNPHTSDGAEFAKSFLDSPDAITEGVTDVFFYGAGCSTKPAIARVQARLEELFPGAIIEVNSDLLGAARATAKDQVAVVCILGTGSNSCLYNGTKIIDQVPNLGYLLGDEGSGFAIGRELLRAFFYRELDPQLTIRFQDEINQSRNELIRTLYANSSPNKIISAYTDFIVRNREHPDLRAIVRRVFDEFITRHIKKYTITPHIPVHFVGSVAYLFRDILESELEKNNLRKGTFLRKPIDALVAYHVKQ